MKIRVLFISLFTNFHSSRPEAEIIKGLAKYPEFDLFVMTRQDSVHVEDFKKLGINVIDFYPKHKKNKNEIVRLRKEVVDNKIDIVQIFNPRAIYCAIRALKGLKVKLVVYRGYSSNIHFFDPFATFKFLHPRIDKIFCNSIGVAEYLHKFPFFDKSKTVVINKGHNIEWYQDIKPAKVREELGISENALLLINVSRNRKMKGLPYLFKAIKILPKDADIHIIILGRNIDNNKNLRKIRRGKNSEKIHILGHRSDALNMVAASDAFVLPSIFGESITKAVLEAMSLGIAPVISDIRGNYELVVNNQTGLVFKSKNYKELAALILMLYRNRYLCKEFGEKSKERIKNVLSNENTVLKVKEFYKSLV